MEILGLIDALEATILASPKVPLTNKTVVDEEKILGMIDKLRVLIKDGPETARRAIEDNQVGLNILKNRQLREKKSNQGVDSNSIEEIEEKSKEVINQAYQVAQEVREGADRYAEEILTSLTVIVTRIMRTIENGRLRLSRIMGRQPDSAKETEQEEDKQ